MILSLFWNKTFNFNQNRQTDTHSHEWTDGQTDRQFDRLPLAWKTVFNTKTYKYWFPCLGVFINYRNRNGEHGEFSSFLKYFLNQYCVYFSLFKNKTNLFKLKSDNYNWNMFEYKKKTKRRIMCFQFLSIDTHFYILAL